MVDFFPPTFCFPPLHSILLAELWTAISVAEFLKCARLLVDLASAQDDAEEWYAVLTQEKKKDQS
jgi:hypothetical protein